MDAKGPSDPTELSNPVSPDADVSFDPSRMVGIIKRKALIRDLAEAYRRECLKYGQELLEFQRKWGEMYRVQRIAQENSRAEAPLRQTKRSKKMR